MASPEQLASLRYFKPNEFKHGDLCDYQALVLLDDIRCEYGFPIIVTDDARLPNEHPAGEARNSLHHKGRAFDVRFPPTIHHLWWLVRAIMTVARERAVELVIAHGPDAHVHIGLLNSGQASSLEVVLE